MKRTGMIGVCVFLALSPAAHAFETIDAAYGAMIRAGTELHAQAEDALGGAELDLQATLVAFAATAAEARDTMDALDGPMDLRCIFNGMSEDAGLQAAELAAAADDAARREALEDIAFLGEDAVLVTPETDIGNEDPAGEGLEPVACESSMQPVSAAQLEYLTEQP